MSTPCVAYILIRHAQAVALVRPLHKDDKGGGEYNSAPSSSSSFSSGFSVSSESNDNLAGDGDLSSNYRCNSDSCASKAAISSSDYGGGASSGSISGQDKDGAVTSNEDDSNKNSSSCGGGGSNSNNNQKGANTRGEGNSKPVSRKRARSVGPPALVTPLYRDDQRQHQPQQSGGGSELQRSVLQKTAVTTAGVRREGAAGSSRRGGDGDINGRDQEKVVKEEVAAYISTPVTSPVKTLPPTARRLAMSAKKTILLRHESGSSQIAGATAAAGRQGLKGKRT